MAELKPCPLCGEEAYIDREEVFCHCGLCMKIEPFYYEQPLSMPLKERWENARKDAIDAWNRRYTDET